MRGNIGILTIAGITAGTLVSSSSADNPNIYQSSSSSLSSSSSSPPIHNHAIPPPPPPPPSKSQDHNHERSHSLPARNLKGYDASHVSSTPERYHREQQHSPPPHRTNNNPNYVPRWKKKKKGIWETIGNGLESVVSVASGEVSENSNRPQRNVNSVGGMDTRDPSLRPDRRNDYQMNRNTPSMNRMVGNTSEKNGGYRNNVSTGKIDRQPSSDRRHIQRNERMSQPPTDQRKSEVPYRPPPRSRQDRNQQPAYNRASEDDKGILTKMFSGLPSPGAMLASLKPRRADSSGFLSISRISNKAESWEGFESEEVASSRGLSRFFPARRARRSISVNKKRGRPSSSPSSDAVSPLVSELIEKERCLVSDGAKAKCRAIGSRQAILDIIALYLLIMTCSQILPYFPAEINDVVYPQKIFITYSSIVQSMDSWAPFMIIASILTMFTNHVVHAPKLRSIAFDEATTVCSSVTISQLWLRLVSSSPLDMDLNDILARHSIKDIYALASVKRLWYFVGIVLCTAAIKKVSMIKPIAIAIISSFEDVVRMKSLRAPYSLEEIVAELVDIFAPLWQNLKNIVQNELLGAISNPVALAIPFSFVLALLIIAWMPTVEKNIAKNLATRPLPDDVTIDDNEPTLSIGTVSDLGSSSASRLQLQSQAGIENVLERWNLMEPAAELNIWQKLLRFHSFTIFLRRCAYHIVAALIVGFPLIAKLYLSLSNYVSFEETVYASAVLFYIYCLNFKAIESTTYLSSTAYALNPLFRKLKVAAAEIKSNESSNKANMQAMAAASPLNGLLVENLWAANSAKRSWAVKGVNFACKGGEIVMLLGEDGCGKSRLLTTLAEVQMNLLKSAKSVIPVKGSVSVSGLNIEHWDKDELKSRLGLVLSDVSSLSNIAKLYSGQTLEEILDPTSNGMGAYHRNHDPKKTKDSITAALKISGLDETLLPRLPAKLSTVVAVSEEDLIPSPLRPLSYPLSPSEWAKLIFSKVIAQLIYLNSNPTTSSRTPNRCMVGNILLIDDLLMHLSEGSEASLLKYLRSTGAAVIISSNRWAAGRFADKVIVMKDGAVIESGSHDELIAKGPLSSVYASKWQQMMSI